MAADTDAPGVIAPPPLIYLGALGAGFALEAALPSASLPAAIRRRRARRHRPRCHRARGAPPRAALRRGVPPLHGPCSSLALTGPGSGSSLGVHEERRQPPA